MTWLIEFEKNGHQLTKQVSVDNKTQAINTIMDWANKEGYKASEINIKHCFKIEADRYGK